jgi:hypothetical protein
MDLSVNQMIKMYISWYILHILATHLYATYCVPLTFHGMLIAPFLTTAGHCVLLRWTIINGGNVPMVVWSMVIVWVGKYAIRKI